MYSTCLFCHTPLGANEAIEHFPIGRRLAYDPAKGRLWVVCRKCERWNLSPLEERWEAIEECERAYRATRLRVSTDNIGLARLAEGLELVRIGEAQRPEFAAWRYGDQFGRRRRRQILWTTGGIAAMGAVFWAGPGAGLITGGAMSALNYAFQAWVHLYQRMHVAVRVPYGERRLEITPQQVIRTKLVADRRDPNGWALVVSHRGSGASSPWYDVTAWRAALRQGAEVVLTGEEAVRAAGLILPKLNAYGGSGRTVRDAVGLVEQAGSPERVFEAASRTTERRAWGKGDPDYLVRYTAPVRLALEMAAHEESERRAMEGELAELERAWREAEEIAAIADDLLVPEGVDELMGKLRRGEGSR